MSELEIRHFRNLGIQELVFPPEGVAIIGDNAQGKTNLLEAIYYLESFRSFRGSGDSELTAFSQDAFHVRGTVAGEGAETVAAGFDKKARRKKVTLGGLEALKISSALGRLGAVVFSPADTELVSGGPSGRRRFLDIVLSLNQPGYVAALQRYRKALAQRNAALKAGEKADAVRVWDAPLVESGAVVTSGRSEWVARWGASFQQYYRAVSGGDEACMTYGSSAVEDQDGGTTATGRRDSPTSAIDDVASGFRERLDRRWEVDRRRRFTTVGPHRDELELALRDEDRSLQARAYGSGGQRRTAALALRLTEAATIRDRSGAEPILLVDDAFAELDEGRSERVMAVLDEEGTGQVILTAPKETDIRLRAPSLARWRIHMGSIEA